MTREEFVAAWRTYAASALQGLTVNGKTAERNLTGLCSQAALVADLMIEEEKNRPQTESGPTRTTGS